MYRRLGGRDLAPGGFLVYGDHKLGLLGGRESDGRGAVLDRQILQDVRVAGVLLNVFQLVGDHRSDGIRADHGGFRPVFRFCCRCTDRWHQAHQKC